MYPPREYVTGRDRRVTPMFVSGMRVRNRTATAATRIDPFGCCVRERVDVNNRRSCSVQFANPDARFFVEFTNARYHVHGGMED
jgi:hypothetical protein